MQYKRSIFAITLTLAFTVCIAPSLRADDDAPKSDKKPAATNKDDARKTDAAQPSLDDLLKIPNDKPNDDQPADPVEPDLSPQAMSAKQAADAFNAAVAEMADAAERLRVRQDAGIATQRIQESVLTRLDAVIAAAASQQNQPNQGAGSGSRSQQQKQEHGDQKNQQARSQQGKPQPSAGADANQGDFSPGSADGAAAAGNIAETRIEWGQLPQRLRDELDQGLGEKFSPIYKNLTEAFYKRLAEESRD